MTRFKQKKKSWKFKQKKNKNNQFPCQIIDVPTADTSAILVNTAQSVRIQARILPSSELNTASVQLFKTNKQLESSGDPLCTLLDNGNLANGDDIAGDNVFSCITSLLEASPGTINLIIQAALSGTPIISPILPIEVLIPLTQEEIETVEKAQQDALTIWQGTLTQFGDTTKARKKTVKEIKKLAGVKKAGISKDGITIWITYESGVKGGLMLNPEGTRGAVGYVPVGVRASRTERFNGNIPPVTFTSYRKETQQLADEDRPVENSNVLIWDAYNSEFSPFDEGPGLRDLFQNSKCPKYNVIYLVDNQCTVNSVEDFTNFGTVILVTHGAVDGSGNVIFLTRETATKGAILTHMIDILLGHVIIMGDVFAITPTFISSLSGSFANDIVYNGSCQSSANNTMANAFIGKGAGTYYGFTRVVNSDFAQNVATQLFTSLVTKLDNTGDSFNPVAPKVDPSPPNATFNQSGSAVVAYSGEFRNGNFETGDFTAWTTTGDGRVIPALGTLSPTEGSFMGIISTGLGFTTSSGTIEQNFCLEKDVTQLKFDWNFNSEEFEEWCNSEFDDTFVVELVTESGTQTLFETSINTLCGQGTITPTSLFFDQSGSGCTPSEGVGFGTGGNDCKVWGTGWKSEALDISGIATANDGKGVTLRVNSTDRGDSIFDSAILLDKIEIVKP